MTTMNISLPDEMKAWVDLQVRKRAFASSSEFFRDLIRRQREVEEFREFIMEGVNSGMPETTDAEFFESLRARAGAEQ